MRWYPRFAHWIEALDEHGVRLPVENCVAPDGIERYYPSMPMTRRDLAVVLSDVLAWEQADVQTVELGDIDADASAAAAIAHMWTTGIANVNDPHCPQTDGQSNFCPDAPLTRDSAAFMMTRVFAAER